MRLNFLLFLCEMPVGQHYWHRGLKNLFFCLFSNFRSNMGREWWWPRWIKYVAFCIERITWEEIGHSLIQWARSTSWYIRQNSHISPLLPREVHNVVTTSLNLPISSMSRILDSNLSQIAKFMGPTGGPPRSCRPQMGLMLAPWTLLSGMLENAVTCSFDPD